AVGEERAPGAGVLARRGGFEVEPGQTALTVFVALLIEIGSGFGMYVAFAYWRMHDPATKARTPEPTSESAAGLWSSPSQATVEAEAAAPAPAQPPPARRHTANDNRVANGGPDSGIQRRYPQRV